MAEPVQFDLRMAHEGTATGVAVGIGEGEGLGVGLGSSLGVGVRLGECEGLGRATSGPLAVQPAMAAKTRMRTTPFLTADETNVGTRELRGIFWGEAVQNTR